ncbi:hypothetical protein AN189_02640 [Loktanella sp. 3ANDIMAR09]|uniref:2-amino-4-hydroxy-6- hydroxymethyldihydropteridine diphosphokinase n=1 Tax=Loktanella sp. 3ANDIMAR09 TaxID=1225657 RepID=UPI0006F73A61|nr:2-amino-4-hydroxy-6-hydroxymethyldihydropteridine diphosphokinase [Loktanella sp. 3ANDIMAR09]KQI70287.1 hypothetical protein AN189_02640 [Loktanella sp. 3ANDIMAR09]
MTAPSRIALVALGGNGSDAPGERQQAVSIAARAVAAELAGDSDVRLSALYDTEAYPVGIGSDFTNAAMAIPTLLEPQDILTRLHAIEADAGRIRQKRWGPRPIDLDLIGLGDLVLPCVTTQSAWRNMSLADQQERWPAELILPHPRVQDRGFVLIPLCDVAPDWVHPVLGKSVRQMCADLPAEQRKGVVRSPRQEA